jgi:ABC-type lipopolysaccharide export system ATPase subunit
MGNMITPELQSKNVKLKSIINILKQQQMKIKNHRRQCVNKIHSTNRRLKHNLMQKKQSPFTEISIEDNIRECAEEILHQRKRLMDLKTCYDVLNSLQYKVQNIMDAYYTQTTLQTVNNSIRDSNINIHNETPLDTGT